MLKNIKKIIFNTDRFLFKKFGSDKSVKSLENIKEARIIFSSLNEMGAESVIRFVGGCVRKALCGEEIDDIDLATSLIPEEVKEKLLKSGVKVIDTGISHGTLTAIVNNKKFEITTLRKDIATDGRHAKVEFTKNWEEDAKRRDFTINAIYVDHEGRIFDPLNGILDLKSGRVKFIGSSVERIQEDYLRILRYVRFYIQYSKTEHDSEVINNIKQNINGLNKISNERIFDELNKILSLKKFNALFSKNEIREIILKIFPQFQYYKRLSKFNKLGNKINNLYDISLILALLIIDETKEYEYFCYKYKLSKKIKDRLKNISDNFENLKNKKFYNKENIKKTIYLTSKNFVKDLLLFSKCIINKVDEQTIDALIDYSTNCKIPKFPISGDFLKEYGYETGEELGKKLKMLEQKWIENDFVIDKEKIKKSLEYRKLN